MTKVRLTQRAYALLSVFIVATLVGIASRDIVLLSIATIFATVLALDLISLRVRIAKMDLSIEPESHVVKLWASEKKSMRVELRSNVPLLDVELESTISSIKSRTASRACTVLELEIEPPYAGRYRLGELLLYIPSRFGTFLYVHRIDLGVEVLVYPRAWLLALVTLTLARTGRYIAGEQEVPSYVRSSTGIYYTSREYVPGDPISRIDWKASTRTLKLVVKEFREEVGGGELLIFDDRCLGPKTCDDIASAALSIALASYLRSIPITLVSLNRRQLLATDSLTALVILAKQVLEMKIVEDLDPYEILPPATRRELATFLEIKVSEPMEIELEKIIPRIASIGTSTRIVTTLIHNVYEVLNLVEQLKMKGLEVSIYVPGKPWIDVRDLENACIAYQTYRLALSKLEALGCRIEVIDRDVLRKQLNYATSLKEFLW